jgi:glycosyltransferase involved in cell wall biosynthesis
MKDKALGNIMLTLFFTRQSGLNKWDNMGILNRELALYKNLIPYLKRINMVTYGGHADKRYKRELEPIKILPVTWHNKRLTILHLLIKHYPEIKNSDILKTNQIKGSEVPLWFKKKLGKNLIVRCGYLHSRHSIKRGEPEEVIRAAIRLEKEAFTIADMGIVTSDWQRDIVIKRYKIDPDKIKVIPNYVLTDIFKPIFQIHKRFDLIFVGRGKTQKNIENLLKAINFLKSKQRNLSLVMVGKCCYERKIRQMIGKHALDVKFKGNVPNFKLPEIINQARVYILPSYFEGHPKTLLEAMSCGMPCIGTDVTGIKEDIEHLITGYLCKTDFKSIAEAIEAIFSDDALQKKLGMNARDYILKNYSLERIVKMELDVIKEVLNL